MTKNKNPEKIYEIYYQNKRKEKIFLKKNNFFLER